MEIRDKGTELSNSARKMRSKWTKSSFNSWWLVNFLKKIYSPFMFAHLGFSCTHLFVITVQCLHWLDIVDVFSTIISFLSIFSHNLLYIFSIYIQPSLPFLRYIAINSVNSFFHLALNYYCSISIIKMKQMGNDSHRIPIGAFAVVILFGVKMDEMAYFAGSCTLHKYTHFAAILQSFSLFHQEYDPYIRWLMNDGPSTSFSFPRKKNIFQ